MDGPDALTQCHHRAQRCRWHPVADAAALRDAAMARVLAAGVNAIRERGRFTLVLAGGSTPRSLYAALAKVQADWTDWELYFSDERCLPADDPQRNSRMVSEAWLAHVRFPPRQVHTIPGELGPSAGAAAYAAILSAVGDFDAVLLGLGEDGHTASLFPGQGWGIEQNAPDALPVFAAPKPPPGRVSLSAARLGRARQVVFLVAGEEKRSAVAAWRAGAPIPAASITPPAGVDVLLLASLL